MRIKIIFHAQSVSLPIEYRHVIQGVIYNMLNENNYSDYIHDELNINKFCFSKLFGNHKIANNKIIFYDSFELYISSIHKELIELLIDRFKNNEIILLNQKIDFVEIYEDKTYIDREEIRIKTLSPVTIHIKDDNNTIYFNPYSSNYNELLNDNYCNKLGIDNMELFYLKDFKNVKKVISKYKGFIIEAYEFEATLISDVNTINLLYHVGLGNKNSIGFGFINLL